MLNEKRVERAMRVKKKEREWREEEEEIRRMEDLNRKNSHRLISIQVKKNDEND